MRFLFTFVILTVLVQLSAQENLTRYTESEIAIQDKFVEAKKFTLIGRFEKAQEILISLYKEDRSNAAVSMELSKVYSLLEDPYNEHKYAQTAHKNDPSNEYVLANYAAICMSQEKFEEALPLLINLVKVQPRNEEYSDKLATAYLEANDAKNAISVYNNLETNIGVTENISRRKFEIYQILNKPKGALTELIKLSDAYPYDIRFLHNVASYQNEMGDEKKALDTYRKILELDINDAQANMAVTMASTGGGNDNNYLRSLTPIIENASIPVDRKVLELVPYVDNLNNDYDQELADALTMLSERLVVIHGDEAKAHAIKGDVLLISGNAKGAAKAYEKTLAINDRNYLVWEGLMDSYTLIEDFKNLKKIATDALDLFPNKASAYMYYGRAYALTGDTEEAIDLLSEGILVSGKDIYTKSNIYAELARAQSIKGNANEAEANISKSLELSENKNGLALEIQGDIYLKAGNTAKAKESWKAAMKTGISSESLLKKING